MKRKIMIVVTSIIGILAIALAIILPIAIQNNLSNSKGFRNIKIHNIIGESSIVRNDKSLKAYKDMNLRNGDSIQTGAEAEMVLKLDSDKYIYIGKNSNVDLTSIKNKKTKTVLRVNAGSIVSEVKNKLTDLEEFEVETPNSTMAIRGTTFAVDVQNTDDGMKIDYRLTSGKIEVGVLENNDGYIDASLFNMLPMQQITIQVEEAGILADDSLTYAVDAYRKNDTANIFNYETVDEYVKAEHSNYVTLSFKELGIEDIQDIQYVLKYNTEDDEIRCVALDSTFDVGDKKNLLVYDSKTEFTIVAHAVQKQGYYVSSWKINYEDSKIYDHDDCEIAITKSSLIVPNYSEAIPYRIGFYASNYDNTIKVNDELVTSRTTIEIAGYANIEISLADGYDFAGAYQNIGNNVELISKETKFKYYPKENATVFFLFISGDENLEIIDKNGNVLGTGTTVDRIDINGGFSIDSFKFRVDGKELDHSIINYLFTSLRQDEAVAPNDLNIGESYYLTFAANFPVNSLIKKLQVRIYDSSMEADVVVTSNVYNDMVKVNNQVINSEYNEKTSKVRIDVDYDKSEYSYLGIYYYNPLTNAETLITTDTAFEENTFEGNYYYNVKFITANLATYYTNMYHDGEFVPDEYMTLSYQQEFDPFEFDFEVEGSRDDEEPYPYDSAKIKAEDAKSLIVCEIRNENQQVVENVDTSIAQATYMISYYLKDNENIRWNLTVSIGN